MPPCYNIIVQIKIDKDQSSLFFFLENNVTLNSSILSSLNMIQSKKRYYIISHVLRLKKCYLIWKKLGLENKKYFITSFFIWFFYYCYFLLVILTVKFWGVLSSYLWGGLETFLAILINCFKIYSIWYITLYCCGYSFI